MPKRTSAVAMMIAAAVIVPVTLFAWGPDRPTHTVENPATYITFNSITNNPDYGDERNFVRIKDASDTGPGNWKDDITVEPGKEYLVQMYVHNNAATSLNLVANNTRVMANVPATTGKNVQIDGFITADNATPKQVWDQARFNSPTDFNVTYVPGSAKLYNKPSGINGFTLSDSIVTSTGALVGYDKLDGNIPGCFNYSGYVSFKVKPQFAKSANFTVDKQVRKTGTTGWTKNVTVNPGDSVDYLVEYKNVGEARTNNVTLKDTLPTGVSYVAGSTTVANTTAPNGVKVMDGITTATGVNIGDYNQGANAFTKFTAKVATADKLVCGVNTLKNTVRAETQYGWKESTADVVVNKECAPTPTYACNYLTITKISKTSFKFDTNYTVENATFKSVTYVIRDASGKEISRSTNATYDQTTVGKYTVEAIVTVTVNGQDKTVTSDNCKKPFEVTTEVKYCKPGILEGDSRCTPCTVPGKENLPKDSPECIVTPVTPTTPSELPTTGMTENVLGVLGIGAMIAASAYYISSRRALAQQ